MTDAEAAARWLGGGNKCSVTGLAATQSLLRNARAVAEPDIFRWGGDGVGMTHSGVAVSGYLKLN